METNIVKIKDLPRVEEILPGDLLIVEDQQGSKAIDFRDFVVGPNNTSFYNGIMTNITAVSTFSHSLCGTVAENADQTARQVRTTVSQLTASFSETVLTRVPNIFNFSQRVIFQHGDKSRTFSVYSPVNNLAEEDFIINLVDPPARLTARTFSIRMTTPTDISPQPNVPLYEYVVGLSALPEMSQVGGTDATSQTLAIKVIKFY